MTDIKTQRAMIWLKRFNGSELFAEVEKEIKELNRALRVNQGLLKHPYKYLFWHIKQKVQWYKLKLRMALFPNKKYER